MPTSPIPSTNSTLTFNPTVDAPNFSCAGYVNITTSDSIVHGQVKQAGKFAFSRIYESGHEVPFYQPLASLEIFERAINGHDIATGLTRAGTRYITKGTPKSTYREGNSTIQLEVTPANATYDTGTGEPNLGKRRRRSSGFLRSVSRRFKPGR